MSRRDSDSEKVPAALYDRLTDTPTYAARMYKVQVRRHQADYAPQAQNPRSKVLQLATETEAAIRAFEAANLNLRRSFAAHLLFRERID